MRGDSTEFGYAVTKQVSQSSHVLIFGAGPAGALTAFLLARMGVRVTLIERHADFAREFRGEGMTPGGMAAIREAGLWKAFEALPSSPILAMEMYSDGRRFLAVDIANVLPRDVQFIRLLAQPRLLQMLVDESSGFEGFTFLRGTVVRDLLMREGRVAGVRVGAPDGGERDLEADYVIAADGRYSTARRRLDLELEGETQAFDVVWCRIPRVAPIEKGAVYSAILEDFFCLAFPAEDDHVQIGRIISKGSYRAFRGETKENWKERLAESLPPPLLTAFEKVKDQSSEPFLLDVLCGALREWSVPGLCFIGDAAHPMSPIGAQGINIALRDAVVAANHLGPLLLSGANGTALDAAARAFESERRPEVDKVQSEQNDAQRQLRRLRTAARVLRFVPDALVNWLARQLLSRPSVRRFTEGVSDIKLTFKPAEE